MAGQPLTAVSVKSTSEPIVTVYKALDVSSIYAASLLVIIVVSAAAAIVAGEDWLSAINGNSTNRARIKAIVESIDFCGLTSKNTSSLYVLRSLATSVK